MSAGRATIGYSVAPAHRGRGIASSALKALTAFAWTIPTLHRIELYIEPWNSNSRRVAEASGFQRVSASWLFRFVSAQPVRFRIGKASRSRFSKRDSITWRRYPGQDHSKVEPMGCRQSARWNRSFVAI